MTLWVKACQCFHYICLWFGMFWITLGRKMQLFSFFARQDLNGFAIFNNVLTRIVCKKQHNVPTDGVSSLWWGQFYGRIYFLEMQWENVRIYFCYSNVDKSVGWLPGLWTSPGNHRGLQQAGAQLFRKTTEYKIFTNGTFSAKCLSAIQIKNLIIPQAAKTSFKQIAWGEEEWKDASHEST